MIKIMQASSLLRITASVTLAAGLLATSIAGADDAMIEKGKKIAFDRKKGNCLACHAIAGGDLPGNIGPPLIAMKSRFPEKSNLRAQIWDATAANPNTIMPPFGKHAIISDDEIDLVVEFIHSL